ncbi:hypothetical protein [Citrobacter youngae]|uniref:hypothetical protein n=1 Tax=Citrobacter youngae TaxID=133448 RepID=UPI00397BDC7E
MDLMKGKVYVVEQESWMLHDRAEYHSTFSRKSDGEPLHNMIIRMCDGGLEVSVLSTVEIISETDGVV